MSTTHPRVDLPPLPLGTLHRLSRWRARINGVDHRRYIMWFMVVVLAHWVEHIFQAAQIWLLGWPRPEARGALGELIPWLVSSEWLHYMYALVMLVGIILLLVGFVTWAAYRGASQIVAQYAEDAPAPIPVVERPAPEVDAIKARIFIRPNLIEAVVVSDWYAVGWPVA